MSDPDGRTQGTPAEDGRAPTMMDVAARAGVSQATVSLVLNNVAGSRLSASTRARVRTAASELGYRLVRRGPRAPDRTGAEVIGFVSDEISTDPWCALQLDAVRERAWAHGYTVVAGVTQGDPEQEGAVLSRLLGQPLIGLVYASILLRQVRPAPALYRVPTVLVNCSAADRSLASVVPAELLGGYAATLRLIQAGHRRIGHIHGQSWTDPSRERLRGYRRALAEHDILYDPALVRPGNWEPPTGYEGAHALMELDDPPTAIFCASDMMALGCYQALHERRLRIPDDVSVMGYDNREIAQFLRPALSTVLLPQYELGAEAAGLLLDAAQLGRHKPQVKVECPLIERESVGARP